MVSLIIPRFCDSWKAWCSFEVRKKSPTSPKRSKLKSPGDGRGENIEHNALKDNPMLGLLLILHLPPFDNHFARRKNQKQIKLRFLDEEFQEKSKSRSS